MKYLLLATALLGLNSCNTSIGIYRDVKHAYNWTADKFQGQGGGSADESGAPVY